MFNFFGGLALAYLAGSGLVTNVSVVGRGLIRAVRKALVSDVRNAGVGALAALAVPAVMSYAAVSSLVDEVFDGASDLASDALHEAAVPLPGREAA